MRAIAAFIACVLMSASPHPAAAQEDCVDQTPCFLGDRSYHVKVPDDWDGVTPMPVIEDAASRYPIDRSQIFVSGYSWGSAMAWRYACENGDEVRALLAVSGTLDQRETCETMPAEVRHTHGLRDTVLDYPFGPGGDELYPVALWRRTFDCAEPSATDSYSTMEQDHFSRTIWEGCATGKVVLDQHPRGHFIPRGWFARQLDELLEPSS